MVKALASHQCGPRSTPGNDAICGLSLLLVLSFAPRGFSPGTPVFLSPQKPTFPNSNSTRNQVDEEPLCGCVTCKSLFIFIYLFIYSFIYNSLLEEYITGWVMYKFRRGQNAEPYSMFQVSWRPKSCLSPGCINTQITRALRKKQRLYRKARRSGTDKSWARFKRHRRSVDRHKRRRHRVFISNVYEPCWKRTIQSPSGIEWECFWNFNVENTFWQHCYIL